MKIILVTNCFYPISKGGTEKYIYLLAKHLTSHNDVRILSVHSELKEYVYEELNVNYISPNTDTNKSVIKGIDIPNNLSEFKLYLERQKPDVVNFQTLSSDFNDHHMQVSFNLGYKTFFTSHIPGHQCLRGDFIYKGKKPCDGKVEKNKCLKCVIFSSNTPLVTKIAKYLYYTLSANDPASLKIKQLANIQKNTNKIIAVCEWQKDFFKKNNVGENHLAICRQEISSKYIPKTDGKDKKIRLGFIGRVDPIKGLDLLLNTLNNINNNNVQLKVAAITPTALPFKKYHQKLLSLSKNLDCEWSFDLDEKQLECFFGQIDYLIIPSLCYETGPFVAYEALAYNTPIIATNIGGQKELVIEGINGYLFEPNEDSLSALLKILSTSRVLKLNPNLCYREDSIATNTFKIYSE